ncbi:MAG: alkaline phosphatase D family protein, partial [Myxococcota bacterium]
MVTRLWWMAQCGLWVVLASCSTSPETAQPPGSTSPRATSPQVTHGVASGDVTADRAVVWSRADRAGVMHVRLEGGGQTFVQTRPVSAETDFTGHMHFEGLIAATEYRYTVWFSNGGELVEPRVGASAGRFMTAPDRGIMSPLVFAWGGDLAGQNVCRDAREGFPVFKALVEEPLDFFIALGDMIYADNGCDATGMYGNAQVQGGFGPAVDMEGFRAHWRYNRQDQGYQRLLSQTPTFAIWDDHEVVNDFGPTTDTRADPPYTKGQPLMPMGLRAFLEYNPVGAEPATAKQIWRSFRWGGHLEVFILDTRQYRAPNNAPDDGPEAKSMLGEPQRQWLVKQVTASKATWKVIISSVPIAIPTGAGATARDGWTAFDGNTGFARELGAIVKAFHDAGTQNLVWMTTDVHF